MAENNFSKNIIARNGYELIEIIVHGALFVPINNIKTYVKWFVFIQFIIFSFIHVTISTYKVNQNIQLK